MVGASAGTSRSTGAVGPVGPVGPVAVDPVGAAVVPVGEGASVVPGGGLGRAVGSDAPLGSLSVPHAASPNAMMRRETARRTATSVDAGTMPPVNEPTGKTVAESQTTLVQLMEITHANIAGIVHGGEVMKLVDTAAGLAAIKHAGGMCVTVSMDEMSFLHPVHVGDLVSVNASVNDVGRTSLEVGVRVEVEHVVTGERKHTSSAYLVFVALDDDGKPRPVPPLLPGNATERRRQREAKIRRETRLAHRQAVEDLRASVHLDPSAPGDEDSPPHLRM